MWRSSIGHLQNRSRVCELYIGMEADGGPTFGLTEGCSLMTHQMLKHTQGWLFISLARPISPLEALLVRATNS